MQYVVMLKPDKVLLVQANSFDEAIHKVEQTEIYEYIFNAYQIEKVIK